MEPAKASSRRCAIYTRKSSEEGLEQDFNSLHAQREACEAFIKSQTGEGWRLVKTAYDDGGLSGGTMERPALQRLLADIDQGAGLAKRRESSNVCVIGAGSPPQGGPHMDFAAELSAPGYAEQCL
jgi:Resolvase, N terminal domain